MTLTLDHRAGRRIGAGGVFVLALLVFGWIVHARIETDIQVHAAAVTGIADGLVSPPANFLYYLALYLFAGLQAPPERLLPASAFLLAAAVAAKFLLTYRLVEASPDRPSPGSLLSFALAMTFAFSLPTTAILEGSWYVGQVPPNVWHNSTTIFLMPFALLLFSASARSLQEPSARTDRQLALLGLLNVAIKPSFFFAYAIAYPLGLAWRLGASRQLAIHLWPVAIAAALLLAEYVVLFVLDIGSIYRRESGVGVYPLVAWRHHSPDLAQSLAASFLFPVVALALYGRRALREPRVAYALALTVVAVAIMALVSETGPRWRHGNFFWQAYVCNYLLFVAVGSFVIGRITRAGRPGGREWAALAALALHVAFGLLYLGRILILGEYE